ncbi:hypothetical protein IAT40_001397 [Kwoniella sp. CBS 6097]
MNRKSSLPRPRHRGHSFSAGQGTASPMHNGSNGTFDVVSVLDPASAGGGGPLTRIETARSERQAQQAQLAQSQSHSQSQSQTQGQGQGQIQPVGQGRKRNEADEEKGIAFLEEHEHEHEHEHGHGHEHEHQHEHDDKDEHEGHGQDGVEAVEEHVYPDGGYGWVVLICCSTLAASTMGYNMNYSVFQEHYANVIFPNEKTSVLGLGGSLCAFFMNFSAFMSGRVGDRYGFKRVLYASAFISWLGVFLASWSTKVWQILLTQGALSGFGFGLAMPLFMSLPSQWFYKRRGLASGIAIGGAGIGGGTSTLISRQLIISVGYQKTLLIFSFINLTAMTLATIFIKTRPTSPEAQRAPGSKNPWFDKEVVRTSEFWSIASATFIGLLGYGMPYMLLTQYIRSVLPTLDSILIAVPPTLLGYMVAVGRALVGFVADLIGPLNTYILVFVLSGIIQLALWYTAKTFVGVMVFAILFGLIAPGWSSLIPQIVVQIFGPNNLATNVGLILLTSAPGALINAPLGGALFDVSGRTTFKYAIAFSGSAQVVGGILACWARIRISKKVIDKV